jgi:hypothetical protein
MAVETLIGIPDSFESGDTVIFTETFSDFPATAWTAALYLTRAGATTITSAAAAIGSSFTFTLSNAVTAAIAAGYWGYAIYATETATTQRATAKTGIVAVLQNLAVTPTATNAQTMVTTLETALASLAASNSVSVSFNGQSFTRANITDYQRQLVYWQSRVIKEQNDLAALRGTASSGRVETRFVQPY